MGLFGVENKSEYYANRKIAKMRIISKLLIAVGIAMAFISIYLCEGKEFESEGILSILEPPFGFIIIGIVLAVVGAILGKYAVIKSVVKAFKTDDNPFMKDKEENSDINKDGNNKE